MYQRIDFSKLGGFPLTQETMAFLQKSYNDVLAAVSRMGGQYVILSGLTINGGFCSDGWVCYDGEIIPFEGGAIQSNVSIVELGEDETYRDGSVNTVVYSRKAIFDAGGSVPFNSFKQLSLQSLNTLISTVSNVANNALTVAFSVSATSQTFTPGMILMWSGNPASVPAGWGLCDGLDGRPNLKGRFIVGYDSGDVDYNAIGKTGGAKLVTLGVSNLPSHRHTISSDGAHTHSLPSGQQFAAWINNEADAGSGSSGNEVSGTPYTNTTSNGSHNHGGNTGFEGSGAAHENRPPYYTLAYIIKL